MDRPYQHARSYYHASDRCRREEPYRWERSRSRDLYRHNESNSRDNNRFPSSRPPSHNSQYPSRHSSYREDNRLIQTAYPKLMQTLQRHRASQEHRPCISTLPQSKVSELTAATLQLKAFLLKLAVDIDQYFLDHHNQLGRETEMKICKTQEPVNTRDMVKIYHFVLHIEEGKGIVHALDVLEYGTKECPYALRLCHQKDH